jgi:multiple sugar transport system substrate-binding protein
MENRKNEAGFFGSLNRVSVLTSDLYKEQYGAVLGQALSDAGKVTIVNFWQDASWPDLGNRWGIILEELITGTRTDIQAGLDELEEYANEIMADR